MYESCCFINTAQAKCLPKLQPDTAHANENQPPKTTKSHLCTRAAHYELNRIQRLAVWDYNGLQMRNLGLS